MAQKKASKNKELSLKLLKKVPLNVLFALLFALSALVALKKEATKVLGARTSNLPNENSSGWEMVVREYPDYRDGWLQLCVSYLEKGEKTKAKEALQMAKTLDPNNEKILLLEGTLKE
jgi:cytochrome c-type biogenesis protein CcmH/NrfG